jgi:hypothetical protein
MNPVPAFPSAADAGRHQDALVPDQPPGPDLDAQRGEERFRGRVEA